MSSHFVSNPKNSFLNFRCHLKNGFQTFRTFTDYIQVIGGKNPTLLQKFVRGLQQRCGGQVADHFEELFDL